MKKIFFLFLLTCFFNNTFSQGIQNRASSVVTVQDMRFKAGLNMVLPAYTDTTAANAQIGIDSCAALIFTYTGNAIYLRGCSPKRWILMASSVSTTNSNIGTGFRWVIPNTNNVKTVFGSYALDIDSLSNTNALTFKLDTFKIATLYHVNNVSSSISGLTNATKNNLLEIGDFKQQWVATQSTNGSTFLISDNKGSTPNTVRTLFQINAGGFGGHAPGDTTYGLYVNTTHGTDGAGSVNIGGYFSALGSVNNYAVQIVDGNQGANKVLTSDVLGRATWQNPAGSGTVNSGSANRVAAYLGAGTTISNLAAINANSALISDANGLPTHSATTATELGYVSGVTSAIQTQLNAKSGTLTGGNGTIANGAAVDLGGTLTADVIIDGGGSYNFKFSSNGSGISTDFDNGTTSIGAVNGEGDENKLTVSNSANSYFDNGSHNLRLGINTNTPVCPLDVVGGNIRTDGLIVARNVIFKTEIVGDNDVTSEPGVAYFLPDGLTANRTFNLPASPNEGDVIEIYCYQLPADPFAWLLSQPIYGRSGLSISLLSKNNYTLRYINAEWRFISSRD